ncbi:uncharacterized protein CTHT_0035840 [Thermochaetoides thermophila DSM 1495]|uniref:BHLH domain-containing protein n=1 Tax=Chaetomium thermophilum (strain DSM 1495 / CBS 144.50 / IMI 039719) TaxID=759272 RepID=G0S719_CHATD|nr:hypothetical protein CTHT_0035840 [Thermochaetoides thermophila DSM 1495]EGS21717.1 hypothetical protein CTHT_0035840 [Thermochaetoides thermophila DSM 1495]
MSDRESEESRSSTPLSTDYDSQDSDYEVGKSRKRRHASDGGSKNKKRRKADQKLSSSSQKEQQEETWTTNKPSSATSSSESPERSPGEDNKAPTSTTNNKTTKSSRPHSHSRTRHNLVEQHYRQRLNSQFKRLLDILPSTTTRDGIKPSFTYHHRTPGMPPTPTSNATVLPPLSEVLGTSRNPHVHHHLNGHGRLPSNNYPATTSGDASNSTNNSTSCTAKTPSGVGALVEKGCDRRVSKAEVLDRARLYIQALEREHRRLMAERRELELLWEEHRRREQEAHAAAAAMQGHHAAVPGPPPPTPGAHHAGLQVQGQAGQMTVQVSGYPSPVSQVQGGLRR